MVVMMMHNVVVLSSLSFPAVQFILTPAMLVNKVGFVTSSQYQRRELSGGLEPRVVYGNGLPRSGGVVDWLDVP